MNRLRRIVDNLGWRCAIYFVVLRAFSWLPLRQHIHKLHPRAVAHPVCLRFRTSDLDVFGQIFSGEEYADVAGLEGVGLIIDGGANVGYSAAYFLSQYPDATVVSVEPDPENAEMLRRNLAPYGDRSVIVEAALWSSASTLQITTDFRDGRHYSRRVVPSNDRSDGVLAVAGVTIDSLMARVSAERVSILKLDVEGAEAELFRAGYESWINAVDVFVIELHDDAGYGPAADYFYPAVAALAPTYTSSGELVIARPTKRLQV